MASLSPATPGHFSLYPLTCPRPPAISACASVFHSNHCPAALSFLVPSKQGLGINSLALDGPFPCPWETTFWQEHQPRTGVGTNDHHNRLDSGPKRGMPIWPTISWHLGSMSRAAATHYLPSTTPAPELLVWMAEPIWDTSTLLGSCSLATWQKEGPCAYEISLLDRTLGADMPPWQIH